MKATAPRGRSFVTFPMTVTVAVTMAIAIAVASAGTVLPTAVAGKTHPQTVKLFVADAAKLSGGETGNPFRTKNQDLVSRSEPDSATTPRDAPRSRNAMLKTNTMTTRLRKPHESNASILQNSDPIVFMEDSDPSESTNNDGSFLRGTNTASSATTTSDADFLTSRQAVPGTTVACLSKRPGGPCEPVPASGIGNLFTPSPVTTVTLAPVPSTQLTPAPTPGSEYLSDKMPVLSRPSHFFFIPITLLCATSVCKCLLPLFLHVPPTRFL